MEVLESKLLPNDPWGASLHVSIDMLRTPARRIHNCHAEVRMHRDCKVTADTLRETVLNLGASESDDTSVLLAVRDTHSGIFLNPTPSTKSSMASISPKLSVRLSPLVNSMRVSSISALMRLCTSRLSFQFTMLNW
jgi:hypothetical protein